MKYKLHILAILLFFSFSSATTDSLWKEVDVAKKAKLPGTAIKTLDVIVTQALKNQKHGEYVKALCERIMLEAELEGEENENRIRLLEKEIAGAPQEAKPLLRLVLARWYWRYYDSRRWSYLSRTEIDTVTDNDFTVWPLGRLFSRIDSLYTELLKHKQAFYQISVLEFSDFLQPGTLPVKLRPTLYDFVVWEALLFYTNVAQVAAKPEDSFEISMNSPAFGPLSSFLKYSPNTTDKESPRYKALTLYKRILAHHKSTGNITALVDAELHRLTYVHFQSEEKNWPLFIKRLNGILSTYGRGERTAIVRFRLAQAWYEHDNYAEAYRIADRCLKSTRDSIVKQACRTLQNRITQKELTLTAEDKVLPLPWEMEIKYKNFDKLYFRAVRDDWSRLLTWDQERYITEWHSRDSSNEKLISKMPDLEWQLDLKPTEDFKTRIITLEMPQLKPGFYTIFASWKPDFRTSTMVKHASIWVSSLMPIYRGRIEGRHDGLIVDALSGEPLEGAEVTIYNQIGRGYNPDEQTTTDSLGHFTAGYKYMDGYALHVKKGEDEYLCTRLGSSGETAPGGAQRTVLFTDRSIYRPGHTIHYKGICVDIDQVNDDYSVIPDIEATVVLTDRNGKKVTEQTHRTNDFGSFSGTFTIPEQIVTGSAKIRVKEVEGNKHIRIEEYKRPSFTVELQKPENAVGLDDSVYIPGKALAYTGGPISDALVRYKVTRRSRFPGWWNFFYKGFKSETKEIAHGELKSGPDGTFIIPFMPASDTLVSEKEQIYTFTVKVDVTSGDGETRSESEMVSLGQKAMVLEMHTASNIYETESFRVKVKASTLDGAPLQSSGTVKVYKLKEPSEPKRKKVRRYDNWYRRSLNSDAHEDRWENWPHEKLVLSRHFNTKLKDSLEFAFPAGVYRIEAWTKDKFGNRIESFLPLMVLPKSSRKEFPIKVPSFATVSTGEAEVGDTVVFLWGTGYGSGRAFVEIMHRGKIDCYWTCPDSTLHTFSVPVEEKHKGGFSARITFVKKDRCYSHHFDVGVPWRDKEIACSLSTFRSVLDPGTQERWTVSLKGTVKPLKEAEMVACMYDISLDQIYPHNWHSLHFFRRYQYHRNESRMHSLLSFEKWKDSWNSWSSYPEMTYFRISRSVDYHGARKGVAGIGYGSGYGSGFGGAADGLIGGLMGGAGGSLELKKRGALKLSQEELDKVNIRENLRETAFFYPHLTMDQNNTVTFDFTVPDALTGWKLLLFAHGKECQNGGLVAQAVTRKKLMVQPNAPRFLREGDTLHFTARITNLSDSALNALVNLEIKDFSSEQKVNQQFGVDDATAETGIPAGESKTVSWRLVVPYGSGPVTYTVRAVSDNHSDGQLGVLPVLSSKKMVTESVPLSIRGPAEKRYEFGKLRQLDTSKTLKPHAFTAQMASNPSWYVLQAFPYLMEFPHECSEQLFSRVYANSLGAHIVKFYPRIKEVLADWHESGSLKSNLHKNKHFKSVLLDQTPWARDARAETDRKIRLSNLLSDSAVTRNISTAMDKLGERQLDNGMWAWFEEKPDIQITICIVAGFGKLNSMGVDVDLSMAMKALVALDKWFLDGYAKRDSSQFNGRFRAIPYYLYARSFFLDEKPLGSSLKTALDYYLDNLESDWPKLYSRMSEGHAALVLNRFGRSETAQAIVESLKERSVLDEEMGRFWRDDEGTWNWYRAPVESQVVMIEALSEVTSDTAAVDECKRWLIKQKQTHSWHSTRATADAVYALVMRDGNPLEDDKLVRMSLGETDITPEEGEAGTGYYEKRFAADEIKSDFCSIMVNKESEGIAWGGVYFQYTDDLSRITPHETDLKLEKKLFVNRNAKGGQVMTPVRGPLEVGDLVTVRLIVRVDRSMEYVHIKDMRPSGFEPVDVLSRSRYIAGTRFFQSTKDAATHFFIDFLPEGDHVLEYRLRVVHAGTYQSGIAEIRNMYAPEFGGHSGSVEVKVR